VDLAGSEPAAVLELTARIRAALKPLTLHDADARRLALAQEVAWLLAEAPGSRVDLAALQARVQALLPQLAALPEAAFADLEDRVHEAQAWLRAKGLRPDQVGHPYPLAEVGRWVPGALLRLGLVLLLLPAALLFTPPFLLVDWAARRFSMEGDLTATLKLLGGVLLHPLWAALIAGLAAWRWGWPWALVPPVALLLLLLALPTLERVAEDLQGIRGFLRRRDPAMPELLEARRQLLAAFPALGR
jgi:hypothetical protein